MLGESAVHVHCLIADTTRGSELTGQSKDVWETNEKNSTEFKFIRSRIIGTDESQSAVVTDLD